MPLTRKYAVLLAVLLCALWPRLAALEHPSFTYDEFFDYSDRRMYAADLNVNKLVSDRYQNGQLLFILSSHFYRWLGTRPWTARFISAVMSLLAIYAVFLFAESVWGLGWAAVAAGLLAFSPFFISCSRLAFSHGYIGPVFFIMAAMLYLQKIMAGGPAVSRRLVVAAGVLSGLAAGTDFLAMFFVPGFLAVIIYTYRRETSAVRLKIIGLYSAAAFLAFFLASPIHVIRFGAAVHGLVTRVRFYNGLHGYLWLGHEVASIPYYYYALIMAVKCEPLVTAVFAAGFLLFVFRYKSLGTYHRLLFFSLWPVICLSLRPWKTPYYLSVFLPVIYLTVVATIKFVYERMNVRRRKVFLALLLLGMFGSQIGTILNVRPDYAMLGIQHGERFYGEFQGPAVSHGQWAAEALAWVRDSSENPDPPILIFNKLKPPMQAYFCRKLGLTHVYSVMTEDLSGIQYVIISREVKSLFSPLVRDVIDKNKALVAFAEKSKKFKVVKILYSADFPMIWIYKRQPSPAE